MLSFTLVTHVSGVAQFVASFRTVESCKKAVPRRTRTPDYGTATSVHACILFIVHMERMCMRLRLSS